MFVLDRGIRTHDKLLLLSVHLFERFPLPRESVAYTQQSMEEALKKVDEMRADLGGTEICKPLKKIYDTSGNEGRPRLVREAEKFIISGYIQLVFFGAVWSRMMFSIRIDTGDLYHPTVSPTSLGLSPHYEGFPPFQH